MVYISSADTTWWNMIITAKYHVKELEITRQWAVQHMQQVEVKNRKNDFTVAYELRRLRFPKNLSTNILQLNTSSSKISFKMETKREI